MNMGDSMQIGPYTLVLQSADATAEKNYTAQRMIIEVLKNNKQMMLLYPEKRRFQGDNQESGTMGLDLLFAARRPVRRLLRAGPGH